MSSDITHHSAALSSATIARFDRELAKYPDDQKQSAVMACLAIVQQEKGFVSADSERAIAAHLDMAPMAVHEVSTFYNMYNLNPWASTRSMCAPTCLANCAMDKVRLNMCAKSLA